MSKHWRKLLAAVIVVLLGGGGILWWTALGNSITRRSYFQVQFNMTRADVERVLGQPRGDAEWTKTETCALYPMDCRDYEEVFTVPVAPPVIWASNRVCIEVWFDANGIVFAKSMSVRRFTGFWGWLFDWLDAHPQAAVGAV